MAIFTFYRHRHLHLVRRKLVLFTPKHGVRREHVVAKREVKAALSLDEETEVFGVSVDRAPQPENELGAKEVFTVCRRA